MLKVFLIFCLALTNCRTSRRKSTNRSILKEHILERQTERHDNGERRSREKIREKVSRVSCKFTIRPNRTWVTSVRTEPSLGVKFEITVGGESRVKYKRSGRVQFVQFTLQAQGWK